MFLDVVSQGAAFKQLHDQIDMLSLGHHFIQFDDALLARELQFAQLTEGSDLAAEEVLGDLVVDGSEVDGLDGYLFTGVLQMLSQVNISRGPLAQHLLFMDCIPAAECFLLHLLIL